MCYPVREPHQSVQKHVKTKKFQWSMFSQLVIQPKESHVWPRNSPRIGVPDRIRPTIHWFGLNYRSSNQWPQQPPSVPTCCRSVVSWQWPSGNLSLRNGNTYHELYIEMSLYCSWFILSKNANAELEWIRTRKTSSYIITIIDGSNDLYGCFQK